MMEVDTAKDGGSTFGLGPPPRGLFEVCTACQTARVGGLPRLPITCCGSGGDYRNPGTHSAMI